MDLQIIKDYVTEIFSDTMIQVLDVKRSNDDDHFILYVGNFRWKLIQFNVPMKALLEHDGEYWQMVKQSLINYIDPKWSL